jgi:hypothetical protein
MENEKYVMFNCQTFQIYAYSKSREALNTLAIQYRNKYKESIIVLTECTYNLLKEKKEIELLNSTLDKLRGIRRNSYATAHRVTDSKQQPIRSDNGVV